MGSIARHPIIVALAALGLGFGTLACQRGEKSEDSTPIVVEGNGPIALGEDSLAAPPSEPEVQRVADEKPQVVTRTVIVREKPAAKERPSEEPQPVAEPAVTAIPSGTSIPIEILAQIDSEHNQVGDSWTARVTHDVVVGGKVVIPAGAAVSGVVTAMDEGDANGGNGSVTLEARSVETVAGTRAISSAPVSGGHSYRDKGFPAKETAIGAGAGAAIGAIVGGKKGAAIGAAAGGAGGAAMGASRVDYEVALNAGSDFTIRLNTPVDL